MRETLVLALVGLALASRPAIADFERWSADVKDDPFSGGVSVVVDYMATLRSGAVFFCDTQSSGIKVRVIPGWTHVSDINGLSPKMEFAIDGKKLAEANGRTGSIGDSLATAEADLPAGIAHVLTNAFIEARKQVAINDGMSDAPLLLGATGSTKSGLALLACLARQSDFVPDKLP